MGRIRVIRVDDNVIVRISLDATSLRRCASRQLSSSVKSFESLNCWSLMFFGCTLDL